MESRLVEYFNIKGRLSSRERILILCFILFLLQLGVYFFVFEPLNNSVKGKENNIKIVNSEVISLKKELQELEKGIALKEKEKNKEEHIENMLHSEESIKNKLLPIITDNNYKITQAGSTNLYSGKIHILEMKVSGESGSDQAEKLYENIVDRSRLAYLENFHMEKLDEKIVKIDSTVAIPNKSSIEFLKEYLPAESIVASQSLSERYFKQSKGTVDNKDAQSNWKSQGGTKNDAKVVKGNIKSRKGNVISNNINGGEETKNPTVFKAIRMVEDSVFNNSLQESEARFQFFNAAQFVLTGDEDNVQVENTFFEDEEVIKINLHSNYNLEEIQDYYMSIEQLNAGNKVKSIFITCYTEDITEGNFYLLVEGSKGEEFVETDSQLIPGQWSTVSFQLPEPVDNLQIKQLLLRTNNIDNMSICIKNFLTAHEV